MKNIFHLLFLSLFFVAYSSCSDNDEKKIYELTFEKSDYAVMNHSRFSKNIMIRSGNGDYTLTPGDKEMIEASYSPSHSGGSGDILVKGLKKGTTTLSVKDNVTGEEVKLNITVTNAYLSSVITQLNYDISPSDDNKNAIQKYMTENALLKSENVLTLIKDEEKTFYIFENGENPYKGNYIYKGTYEFVKEGDLPYVELNYKVGEIEKSIKYGMGGNAVSVFNYFYDLGWISQKSDMPATLNLNLYEDYIERLKPGYPDIEKAILVTPSILFLNIELHLDLIK